MRTRQVSKGCPRLFKCVRRGPWWLRERRLAAYACAPTTTTTTQRGRREKVLKRTGRLGAGAGGDLARLLEVDVPALGLAGLVLEGEGEDGAALLDGVLALGVARGKSGVDGVEGGGGGEVVCE